MVKKNITTIVLNGEIKVQFDKEYNYFFVNNLSGNEIYMSMENNISADKDGVIIIPEGSSAGTMHGYAADSLYVSGSGKVQIMGCYSANNPFKKNVKGGEIKTANGNNISVNNSVNFPLLALTVYGKSTQGYASYGGTPMGKNILMQTCADEIFNGVTFTKQDDGSIVMNGTATGDVIYTIFSHVSYNNGLVFSDGDYTISFGEEFDTFAKNNLDKVYMVLGYTETETNTIKYPVWKDGGTANFSTDDIPEKRNFLVRVRLYSGVVCDNIYIYPQIEKGDVATPYEPYKGSPNPDCPVPIESIGDSGSLTVTTCGKNLLSYPYKQTEIYINGGIIKASTDGSLTFSGTPSDQVFFDLYRGAIPKWLKSNVTLSLQGQFTNVNIWLSLYDVNNNILLNKAHHQFVQCNLHDYPNASIIAMGVKREENNIEMMGIGYPQLELGAVVTDYEPYKSTTATITTALPLQGVPVSSGGNYTDSSGQEWVCDTLEHNYSLAVKKQRIAIIDSYNGEEVRENYMSTTGGLDVGATIIYQAETVTEIPLTEAEINQLRNLSTFDGITNIYNNENADISVKYLTSKSVAEAVMPIITQ